MHLPPDGISGPSKANLRRPSDLSRYTRGDGSEQLTVPMLNGLEAFLTQDIINVDQFWMTCVCHSVVTDENDVDDV